MEPLSNTKPGSGCADPKSTSMPDDISLPGELLIICNNYNCCDIKILLFKTVVLNIMW